MENDYFAKPEKLKDYLNDEDKELWNKIVSSVQEAVDDFDHKREFNLKILREPMKV